MRVEFHPDVDADLVAIGEYIAEDDPVAAVAWVEKLLARADKVGDNPRAGRLVPEREDPSLREVILGAYRIVYRIDAGRVLILLISEGHKLLPLRRLR